MLGWIFSLGQVVGDTACLYVGFECDVTRTLVCSRPWSTPIPTTNESNEKASLALTRYFSMVISDKCTSNHKS